MTVFKRLLLFPLLLLVFLGLPSFAAGDFVVQHIEFEGLQRVSPATVRSYLPIHEGQPYTAAMGNQIITSLYNTGFFNDVSLSERGNALIILVKERPVISLIQLSGNKAISTEKLRPVLKKMGIVEGEVFNSVKLNEIEQGLVQQYNTLGYRAPTVSTNVVNQSRNRVALYITVHEGTIAKVRRIQIIGNHAFSQRKLLRQFKLTTPGIFTWISHKDRYSEIKLQEDLQRLGNFYLDHGYLRFRIVSQQVTLTPDNTGVYIVITVDEGPLYHISGYALAGQTFGFQNQLYPLITLKAGDVSSRQRIIDTTKAIGNFLADRGYAFANVNVIPNIDDARHTVYLTFNVVPGERIYVRHINFFGNQRTDEIVLRREMRQYEASTYSLSKIEESKRRLQLLGYFDDITIASQPVPGTSDQVDLNYHVKEVESGRASIQGGYSDVYGFLYGASISEPNFMGSGKYASIGFQNSEYSDYYAITYNNPYYTTSGVSRGFSIYYSHMKPNPAFNLQPYLMDGYGIDVNYGLPISERNTLGFGYGYEHIAISDVVPGQVAPSVLAFLGTTHGVQNTAATYNQFKLTGGWTYNGLDRAIFPTKGFYNGLGVEIGVPIVDSSLDYYTATYTAKYYQPVAYGFIMNFLATLAYGNGLEQGHTLPFYKNFYAGGIGSVPAFSPNSLGPKNTDTSPDSALGGNAEAVFGAHLILPPFINSKIRTAIILDAGNVFELPQFPGDIPPQVVQNNSVSWRNLRPSLGFGVEWWSPLGPIDLSLAFPLDKQSGDAYQPFQFSFGVSL